MMTAAFRQRWYLQQRNTDPKSRTRVSLNTGAFNRRTGGKTLNLLPAPARRSSRLWMISQNPNRIGNANDVATAFDRRREIPGRRKTTATGQFYHVESTTLSVSITARSRTTANVGIASRTDS